MRLSLLFIVALLMAVTVDQPASGDEAAVKKVIQDYAAAFNAQDLEAVMGFWSESGRHVDRETGELTNGRDAIREDISAAFQQSPGTKLVGIIDSLRFIKPDVASVSGQVSVNPQDGEPSVVDFSAILVEQDGQWIIDTIEESPVPVPSTPYDALSQLEWIVGTWSDNSQTTRVSNVFRWSANNSFLIRSFSAEASEGVTTQGTQVIGWDPRSQEIRSWTFNSDGSFGDATWSRSGEDWLIQSTQTLPGGEAASGTYVLSRNGDDEMTVRLIGHDIDGEPQPTQAGVTVTRERDVPSVSDTSSVNQE